MRRGYNYYSKPFIKTLFAVLGTLMAWTTAASLFVILKLSPLTRSEPENIYYPALASLLPWLMGFVLWTKVRKREKLAKDDKDAIGLCYGIVFFTMFAAYGALISVETVLLSVLTRVH